MNLQEWRSNPERRALALDMLRQPTLQEMLSIMDGPEHPSRQQHGARDGFGATKALGRIEGYQEALDKLRSFVEPLPLPQEQLKVTWGVDKDEEQQST